MLTRERFPAHKQAHRKHTMPLDATIGTSFLNTYGKTSVDLQTFAGDSPLVGIYFSADCCGP